MGDIETDMSKAYFEKYFEVSKKRLLQTLDHVPPATGEQCLLDIGCYGPMLPVFSEYCGYSNLGAVALYDWGPSKKERLLQWAERKKLDLKVWIGDVENQKVPWEDGIADTVLMLEILEHFAIAPMHAIAEANRLLKEKGVFLLSTPNGADFMSAYRTIFLGRSPHSFTVFNGMDSNRHNRYYDAWEIKEMLKCGGFGDIEIFDLNETSGILAAIARFMLKVSALPANFFRPEKASSHRGDFLLVKARKVSPPKNLRPSFLYGAYAEQEDWLEYMGAKEQHPPKKGQ